MVLKKSGKLTPEKNEKMGPKQKQCPDADVTGDGRNFDAVNRNIL